MNNDHAAQEYELLASRTRKLARPLDNSGILDATASQFVAVLLDEETYAFSARYVLCARHAPAVVTMPDARTPLAGVTVYEGEILPVFYLRNLVGMPPQQGGTDTWLLVLGQASAEIGLLVDRVNTVSTVDTADLSPGWIETTSSPNGLLAATTPDGVTIINVEHLLGDPRLVVDADSRTQA